MGADLPRGGRTTEVVAVTNRKGGVGRTSMVVNLAAALSAAGSSVHVVDLDPRADATAGLGGSRSVFSVLDVLAGRRALGARRTGC